MSTQQTKVFVLGALVALLSIAGNNAALAAGKAGVGMPKLHASTVIMAKEIQVAATGDGPATEKDCKKFEAGVNSWGQEEVDAMERGDEAASRRAKSNVEGLINDATDSGCFVIY